MPGSPFVHKMRFSELKIGSSESDYVNGLEGGNQSYVCVSKSASCCEYFISAVRLFRLSEADRMTVCAKFS